MAECLDHRQARDIPRLASEGFPVALAMEIEASRQATIARRGSETDPENGSGESDVGGRSGLPLNCSSNYTFASRLGRSDATCLSILDRGNAFLLNIGWPSYEIMPRPLWLATSSSW